MPTPNKPKPKKTTVASAPKPRAKKSPRREKKKRVVVLDDNVTVVTLWRELVGKACNKAEVLCFTDSMLAWEELQSAPPALLITDLVHPGIKGLEMIKRLAIEQVTYPILVDTASFQRLQKKVAKAAGPDLNITVFAKPFFADEMIAILKQILTA